ncbi:MAG TPA: HNH endonuclease signature motif containing protein [Candidatus Paceibacterota bacterium]|nr:HNH endonuclease signature motif containing protein [Candidatus Paceibacterota bacterium]
MAGKRKWSDEQLRVAVKNSGSIRQVLKKLDLIEAGGNYTQIRNYINDQKIDSSHFHGKGWNIGLTFKPFTVQKLSTLLVTNSKTQSYKLKVRLFKEKIKEPACEICGWSKMSIDGRIPVELDHINGDRYDNRLENLRILCPNCHSLQLTHRGKNKKKW